MLLNSQFAQADDMGEKLSLDEAISLAVEQNFNYLGRRKDVDIATEGIKYANRLQNPYLNVLFNLGNSAVANNNNVGLALPIEVLKRSARKAKAIAEKSVATSGVELSEFELKMNVREAYIRLAAAKSILEIVSQQKDTIFKMFEIASKRFDVGVSPEIEKLQAKIIYDQLITVYNEAQTEVSISRYYFNKTLGVEEDSNYDIVDSGLPQEGDFMELSTPSPKDPLPPYEKIKEMGLENRLDISIAQKEIEVARKNITVIARNRVPDLGLVGGYAYVPASKNDDQNQPGLLSGAYVGGALTLPVLYTFTPEINIAKRQLEQKELALRTARTNAIAEIKSAYAGFAVSRQNLNYYLDELLKESETVLQASSKSYLVGKSNLSTLILMQQAKLSILTNYVEELVNYYVAWINLLRVINSEGVS